jgi:hypothetical protein
LLKKHLLGNLQFLGELFRRYILKQSVIISVFDLLLGVETQTQEDYLSFINDSTVDGAVMLLEKIGYILLETLSSISIDKDKKGKIIKIFSRFE